MSINDEEQLCDMIELQDKIVGDFTASATCTGGSWGPQLALGLGLSPAPQPLEDTEQQKPLFSTLRFPAAAEHPHL